MPTGAERRQMANGAVGATGKMPFVAALSLSKKGHPQYIKFSQLKQFTLKEISNWSVRFIQPGSSVLTDGLACFPGVAVADCKHNKVVTYIDGRYANGEMFKWLNIVLGNIKNALRGTYHALSNRHLPRYLAEVTDSIDVSAWTPWSNN